MNDLRYAFRQLLKNPGFTAVAVLTLALGIGANTAIFQLLNAVRLKTLPVSKPQELIEVRIVGGNPGIGISDGANAEMTYPLWEHLQKQREAFSGIFAWSTGELPIGSGVETRNVKSLWTSGEFFYVLGVPPLRGRLFNTEDDRRGAGPGGVVISYAFWQSEFGGQDSAIGKSLTLGDRVFQIIGVTPPAFFGLEVGKSFDVAVPISTRALWWDNVLDRRDAWWLRVMGRLKPGATVEDAAGYVNTISPGIIEATVPTGYGPGAGETYRKFRLSAFPAGTGVSQLRDEYGSSWTMGVRVTGAKEVHEGSSKITWVSPDFFRTMEIPILSGRDFNEHDTATSPKVALVNETFLRQYLGNADPIGATVRTGAEPGYPEATYEVIGVVKDAKYGNLRQEIPPIAFAPAHQHPISGPWAAAVVRSSEPLPGVIAAVKQRVAELDRSIRMDTSVLKTQVREGLARERLMAWLSGFFGLLAAVLVMIGLYGLLSFITLTRRNELGIRLALGARRGNILWLVIRHGLKLAACGVAIGLAGALVLTRLLSGLLFGIDPSDPATLVAISLLLIAVASLACWLPARRAARVDPMAALRYE